MGLFSRDPDDDDDDGAGPFEGRAFILSAIVVGAVVVCAVALLVLGRDRGIPSANPSGTPTESVTSAPTSEPTGPPATADPSQPTTSATSPPTKQNGPLPCKRPPSEELGLTAPPPGVSWDFDDGILVPVKDDIGPGITDEDGLKRCYHHSPAGAVFAALTTVAQAQDPRRLVGVVERRVVPGKGQQLALAEARRLLASPTPDTDRNALGQVQYVGYKVVDYTPTRTILSVAIQVDAEHVGGVSLALVWSDGDWKIQLRPDGQLGPDPDVLASLDGYIRFRGS